MRLKDWGLYVAIGLVVGSIGATVIWQSLLLIARFDILIANGTLIDASGLVVAPGFIDVHTRRTKHSR